MCIYKLTHLPILPASSLIPFPHPVRSAIFLHPPHDERTLIRSQSALSSIAAGAAAAAAASVAACVNLPHHK